MKKGTTPEFKFDEVSRVQENHLRYSGSFVLLRYKYSNIWEYGNCHMLREGLVTYFRGTNFVDFPTVTGSPICNFI